MTRTKASFLTSSRFCTALSSSLGLVGALGLGLAEPQEAKACGGCFAPQDPPTVVTGHRMVMSVSPTQSVLWDQIQYSGEPEDFAWVLPVKAGARVEASTAAFFEVLEANTALRVIPPQLDCGGGSSSGCFASNDLASGGDFEESPADPTVEVLHQGTVGPYETVTLGTDEPGALNTWLSEHGYNVDPSTQPIIDSYVAEGFDFIALRLQPGKGINQMTPVRVVMEGMNLSLPLRMVGIGTGAFTPIVLYVLSEGRYTTANFSEVAIQQSLLSWNFKTSESNYTELRETALEQNDGRSFLTAFAGEGPFFYNEFDGGGMVDSYLNQAFTNNETTTQCQLGSVDPSARVVNPCPVGEPWDSPACGTVQAGEQDVRTLGCAGVDDMAVALTGLRPNLTWITRLEANLPRTALDQDLTLEASASQVYVTNQPQAVIALEPEGACPSGLIPRVIQPGETPRSSYFIFGGMLVASAALMSRRRMMRSA